MSGAVAVLGIDPGPTKTAYVIWDGNSLLDFGLLPNSDFREYLSNFSAKKTYVKPVIELIGHYGTGMPAGQEVFDTCRWIGRYEEILEQRGMPAVAIKRPTIKAHICGSARAKDPHVRQALIDRVGAPGTSKNPGPTYGVKADIWAALAVAVYGYDECRG